MKREEPGIYMHQRSGPLLRILSIMWLILCAAPVDIAVSCLAHNPQLVRSHSIHSIHTASVEIKIMPAPLFTVLREHNNQNTSQNAFNTSQLIIPQPLRDQDMSKIASYAVWLPIPSLYQSIKVFKLDIFNLLLQIMQRGIIKWYQVCLQTMVQHVG